MVDRIINKSSLIPLGTAAGVVIFVLALTWSFSADHAVVKANIVSCQNIEAQIIAQADRDRQEVRQAMKEYAERQQNILDALAKNSITLERLDQGLRVHIFGEKKRESK